MLLFIDSFDHYGGSVQAEQKWSTLSNATYAGGNARTGSQGIQCGASNTAGSLSKILGTNESTLIMGSAVRFGSFTPSDASTNILSFLDGVTTQIALRQSSDGLGKLILYRGDGTTQLDITGNNAFSVDVWCYIEMKVTFDGTSGSVEVRLNGSEILSFSGDTTQSANNYANVIKIAGYRTQSGAVEFDDFYLCNGSGGVNDDFLGDVRVDCLHPNGNGNTSQLVGNDGNSTDNYLLVDETTSPNSDTDYVQSATVDEKDTYAFDNLVPTTGTVFGVQINAWARKTDAGARGIKSVARHSATEEDSAASTLSTTYSYHRDIRETKPGGGTWTISDVNGAEFGVKVAAA